MNGRSSGQTTQTDTCSRHNRGKSQGRPPSKHGLEAHRPKRPAHTAFSQESPCPDHRNYATATRLPALHFHAPSTSSVVGGAGLLHPPDGAEVGRGQDRKPDARLPSASVAPSGEAAASPRATSCLLRLSAAALSKRSSQHDSTTGLGGATFSASDTALLLPPRSERPLVRARTIAFVLALAHTGRSQKRHRGSSRSGPIGAAARDRIRPEGEASSGVTDGSASSAMGPNAAVRSPVSPASASASQTAGDP